MLYIEENDTITIKQGDKVILQIVKSEHTRYFGVDNKATKNIKYIATLKLAIEACYIFCTSYYRDNRIEDFKGYPLYLKTLKHYED